MAEAAPKRLTFEYRTGQATGTDQGTIHAELMVFERGSWVALPVYQPSCDTVNGRQVVSGYVESQTDRKFRANLTYTCNAKRTARWQIDHPILSAMYVDGRRKPVCEHSEHLFLSFSTVYLSHSSARRSA